MQVQVHKSPFIEKTTVEFIALNRLMPVVTDSNGFVPNIVL